MTSAADPPFVKYAAKTVAALAAAVVGAGAVILAAVDDGHVTSKEWVAIGLAVLAGIGGPAAVYAVRNAVKPDPVADDRVVVRAHVDGTVDIVWPEGKRGATVISPELLEGLVKSHNDQVTAAARQAGPWAPPDATP